MASGSRDDRLAWVAYVLGAAILLGPWMRPGVIVYGHDAVAQFLPWREHAAEEIAAGRFPGWNPYLFCGVPFAANPQTGIFYPPSLFFLLPAEVGLTASAALHLALAAIFAHQLARALGARPMAATAAGWSWGFGGFATGHLMAGHATILAALPWLPLVVWSLVAWRAGGSRRWIAAGGVGFALALLAGHPQFAWMTGLAGASYALFAGLASPGSRMRFWAGAAAMPLLGVLLAAVQLIPAWEFARQCARGEGLDAAARQTLGAPPEELLGLGVPDAFGQHDPFFVSHGFDAPGGREPYRGRGANWETGVYIGIAPLVLGFVALPFRRRRRGEVALAAAVVVATWLALGSHGAGYDLAARVLPGLDLFRVPARFLFLSTFGLSILGALGFEAWLAGGAAAERARRAATGAASMIALLAIVWGVAGDPAGSIARTALVAAAAAIAIARGPRPGIALALALLVAGDLVENARHAVRPVVRRGVSGADDSIEHERVRFDEGLETINGNLLARRRIAGGYDPLIPADLERLVRAAAGESGGGPRTYLNPPALPSLARVLAIPSGGGPPRAYLAGSPRSLGEEDALRVVLAPGWDPVRGPVAIDAGAIDRFDPPLGDVEFRIDEPGRIVLRTNSSGPALLVLADRYDPDWTATIDGEPTEILRVQWLHRGVIVEGGSHDVEFVHRPGSLRAGALTTLVGIAVLLLVVRRGRRPQM